jgi:hypothetical protein
MLYNNTVNNSKRRNKPMKQSKTIGVYLTEPVYRLWCNEATAKEIAMYMYPTNELKTADKYDKGDFIMITFRMPMRWIEWYKNLSREEKYEFAKLVEARLKEVGIL